MGPTSQPSPLLPPKQQPEDHSQTELNALQSALDGTRAKLTEINASNPQGLLPPASVADIISPAPAAPSTPIPNGKFVLQTGRYG